MISRRTIPWMACGALGASICIATACSSSSAPGFLPNDGGVTSTGQNTESNTTSGGQVTSTGTSAGPSSTGGSTTGTGTGSAATTTGSGTGSSTGTSSSTNGAMFCANASNSFYSGTCSAPVTTGAIALEGCVPVAITNNSSGYVVAVGDGTSAACVDTNAICAQGTAQPQNPPKYSVYGSGISISLGTAGVAASGSGLTYAVSSVPTYGLEISITTTTGTQYFAEVPATGTGSGTIMWSTFNTTGFLPVPDGGSFSPSGSMIMSVGFQANAGPSTSTATAWSFCVTTLTL